MIRYLTFNGEEFPCKFGFSAFMRVKNDMSELESVICICFHAIKIAARKVKPSILNDPRLIDLDTFADEIFSEVAENPAEIEAITEAIQNAQGKEKGQKKTQGSSKRQLKKD